MPAGKDQYRFQPVAICSHDVLDRGQDRLHGSLQFRRPQAFPGQAGPYVLYLLRYRPGPLRSNGQHGPHDPVPPGDPAGVIIDDRRIGGPHLFPDLAAQPVGENRGQDIEPPGSGDIPEIGSGPGHHNQGLVDFSSDPALQDFSRGKGQGLLRLPDHK
ncbi:hypothetical protein BMS3Abin13_01964 [bacterium BMS3Abin13]|nr:hypothetical protein BMS3Abin13_01964 [bacterium BMS3Abin13]